MKEFEYGGIYLHATDRHSVNWKNKYDEVIPPVEDFHKQMSIFRQVKLYGKMSDV